MSREELTSPITSTNALEARLLSLEEHVHELTDHVIQIQEYLNHLLQEEEAEEEDISDVGETEDRSTQELLDWECSNGTSQASQRGQHVSRGVFKLRYGR